MPDHITDPLKLIICHMGLVTLTQAKVLHDKTKLKHIIYIFFSFPDSTISVVCCSEVASQFARCGAQEMLFSKPGAFRVMYVMLT